MSEEPKYTRGQLRDLLKQRDKGFHLKFNGLISYHVLNSSGKKRRGSPDYIVGWTDSCEFASSRYDETKFQIPVSAVNVDFYIYNSGQLAKIRSAIFLKEILDELRIPCNLDNDKKRSTLGKLSFGISSLRKRASELERVMERLSKL